MFVNDGTGNVALREHRVSILHLLLYLRVVSKTSLWIARLMWVLPAILLALGLYQVNVALDIRTTLREGQLAQAEVIDAEVSGRTDVTYDYISVRAQLADGTVIEREKMSLPHSIAMDLEGQKTLEVRVLPGSDQPIVVAELGRAHWRIAAINAAMCAVGVVMLSVGVFAWNRYLNRKGDPALRSVALDA